jgi:hypothetical protein
MHHGWPNLGHEALGHAVENAVCDVREFPGTAVRPSLARRREAHAPARHRDRAVGTGARSLGLSA